MPKVIASFLKLPNPELYTGHCFRRSSVSHLANTGSDLITIKRHGGWKSSAVAEGYIDSSLQRKIEVAHVLSDTNMASSSSEVESSINLKVQESSIKKLPGINIHAKDTSTVSFNIYGNCTFINDKNVN